MAPREVHHERHLGLSNFVCKHAAFADTILMHMQHNCVGVLVGFVEKLLQDVDDKFHWREIVV